MSKELDIIYADRPMGIDLSEKKVENKKVKVEEYPMSFWKTTGQIGLAVLLIGGGVVGAGVYHNATATSTVQTDEQKKADQKKLTNQTLALSTDEERDLERIKKFCFSPFPWDRDVPTCKVWLRHYRQLDKYSDEDLFKEEIEANAEDALAGLQNSGKEQSPAKD